MIGIDKLDELVKFIKGDGEDRCFVRAAFIFENRLKLTKTLVESVLNIKAENHPDLIYNFYKCIYQQRNELISEEEEKLAKEPQETEIT